MIGLTALAIVALYIALSQEFMPVEAPCQASVANKKCDAIVRIWTNINGDAVLRITDAQLRIGVALTEK